MTELMTELLAKMQQRGDDGDDRVDDGAAVEDGAAQRRWS